MREKVKDRQKALSIIDSAKEDMKYTFTIKPAQNSANTIVRNVYECFRMLGEALLINKGLQTSEHVAMLNELISLDIETPRSLNLLDGLRRLRHSINYYGYRATIEEAESSLELAKVFFEKLFNKVKDIIIS